MNNPEYAISDSVIARIVQIIQEGMILGIDVSDLMRQIRVTAVDGNLVLTDVYKQQVKDMHEKLLQQAEGLKQVQQANAVAAKQGPGLLFS